MNDHFEPLPLLRRPESLKNWRRTVCYVVMPAKAGIQLFDFSWFSLSRNDESGFFSVSLWHSAEFKFFRSAARNLVRQKWREIISLKDFSLRSK